jgi:hypothetical protein
MADIADPAAPLMAPPRAYGAPSVNFESAPFHEGAARGEFLIKRCGACGEAHYYPRLFCPFCFSEDTVWERASGEGEIYTFSITYIAGPPFAVGYVILQEGPAVLTNFVDCDLNSLRIGQKVRVTFAAAQGGAAIPVFKPLD